MADILTVTEGVQTAVLTFTLNAPPDITAMVEYETLAETAVPFDDYLPISGTLIFLPHSTVQTVTLHIVDDDVVEMDETLTITLSSPVNMVLDDENVQIVIQDDDEETAVVYLPVIMAK